MRILVTALIAVSAVVISAVVATASAGAKAGATPSAADCQLDGFTFPYWGGGDAESAGIVACETRKAWIRVFAVVTRDGAFVAAGEHRCSKASRCRITFAPLDDPDGDQQWCVEVRGEVQGGPALGPRTFCEAFDTI